MFIGAITSDHFYTQPAHFAVTIITRNMFVGTTEKSWYPHYCNFQREPREKRTPDTVINHQLDFLRITRLACM